MTSGCETCSVVRVAEASRVSSLTLPTDSDGAADDELLSPDGWAGIGVLLLVCASAERARERRRAALANIRLNRILICMGGAFADSAPLGAWSLG